MEFDARNNIVKLCVQGMVMEENGKAAEASELFLQAWNEAANKFEKFIAAYYVALHQNSASEKLQWLQTTLQLALEVNDDSVKAAFPALYLDIAKCYEQFDDSANAKKNYQLAES